MLASLHDFRSALDRLGDPPTVGDVHAAVMALRLAWMELVTRDNGPRDQPVLTPDSEALHQFIDELSRKIGLISDTQLDPLKERIAYYRFMLDRLRSHGTAEVMDLLEECRCRIGRGLSITEALQSL